MMELYRECMGEGTPVLLIHGVLSDRTFFAGVARRLSHYCQVISYDRRGYGDSPPADGTDHSLRAQAEDAYHLLAGLTDRPACVVGHSAGAHIALELAIRHPRAVKQVVLIEPSLGFCGEDAQRLAGWYTELVGYARRKQWLKIVASFQRVTGATRSAALPLQPPQMERMRKNIQAFVQGDLQELGSFVPEEAGLRRLTVPVTVAVTRCDSDNLFFHTAMNDSAYFGWPVVPFPGSHSSIEEVSEPFARKLVEILQIE